VRDSAKVDAKVVDAANTHPFSSRALLVEPSPARPPLTPGTYQGKHETAVCTALKEGTHSDPSSTSVMAVLAPILALRSSLTIFVVTTVRLDAWRVRVRKAAGA